MHPDQASFLCLVQHDVSLALRQSTGNSCPCHHASTEHRHCMQALIAQEREMQQDAVSRWCLAAIARGFLYK